MRERWKSIAGFEGFYEVSDLGRIRGLTRKVSCGDRQITVRGRILKTSNSGPYGIVVLRGRDGDGKVTSITRTVHRVVLEAFVGRCPEGMEACHENDNGHDNRLVNLSWGTHRVNSDQKVKNGGHHLARLESCKRGHLFDGPNLVITSRGHRECWACAREREKAYRDRAPFDDQRANRKYRERMRKWPMM